MKTVCFSFLIFLQCISSIFADVPTTPDNVCLPNPPSLKAEQLSAPFSNCDSSSKTGKHPDQDLKTPQVLTKYQYPFKTYNITTDDGYILTVFRITGSPKAKGKQNKQKKAVYVNHGLGMASDCWNFQPGSRNLPFKLADAGYEVWLGNARGTTYSLGHTKYNAETDLPYWNFSWNEMAMFDVPKVTDTILKESKNKKIFYIGHSMGTTQYFIALSEIPNMNDKILAGFMLAPIGFLGHANSGLRLAAPAVSTDALYQAVNAALAGRLNSPDQFNQYFKVSLGDVCDATAAKCGVCDNLMYLLFGYDAPQMNTTELPNMFGKFPNNIAVKVFAHYAQTMLTCTFKKYDYGPAGNLKAYKSATPPAYKLQNIKAPTYFYYGNLDNLGPPNDAQITAKKLSPGVLKSNYKVKHELFNHMDFIVAKDADKLVYNQILSEMQKFK